MLSADDILSTTGTNIEVVAALEAICDTTEHTKHNIIRITGEGSDPTDSRLIPKMWILIS